MTQQQIPEGGTVSGSAMNGYAGEPPDTSTTRESGTRDSTRGGKARIARTAGAATLSAAGALRDHANHVPGGKRGTRAAKAVADRMENVANRALGRQQQSLFGRIASAITDNKFKAMIGAALLALAGVVVTQRAFTSAVSKSNTELADEA